MFTFGRLTMLTMLGVLVYLGFFAPPIGGAGAGDFAPAVVAEREVSLWQSARAGEEFGAFTAAVALERERHRYTWFRALEAGYQLSRATVTFAMLEGRYERVLPNLEAAAAVHLASTGSTVEPAAVARAQLNWWITRRLPNLNTLDRIAPLIATEYELRYRLRPGAASEAAGRMAEATQMFDASTTDPDLPAITKMLTDAYQALQRTIVQARPPARD